MISFLSKEWVVWAIVGLLSLIGMWAYGQHRYGQGQHSRDAEVANLNTQLAQAAVALNQCTAATEKAQIKGEAQKAMADAALNAAISDDKGRTKELARAVDGLRKVSQTGQCKAAAEVELCTAMSSY
jgi:hypothetical protein